MILRSMTATFGCLDNATLDLGQGLNLIELPNERGKSTWCAFLRAMLYGLDSRKGGVLSERNRALPWSGAPMSGSLELIWKGQTILLRRFPKGSNPFGGFQAVYAQTQEAVPGLTADNVGETLLGVTKEVFQRTCFIPQGGLQVDGSGELERRIAALASSGQEDVSFSDAEGRLRSWRNARQANRATGSLPKLRAQLVEAQSQRQRLLDAQARCAEADANLRRLEKERIEIEADLARHARLEAAGKMADQRSHYEKAGNRLQKANAHLAAAETAEETAHRALPTPPGSGRGGHLALSLGILLGCALMACAILFSLWPLILGGVALLNIGALGNHLLAKARRTAQASYDRALQRWQEAKAQLDAAQAERIAAQAAWDALRAQGEPPAPPAVDDLPRHDLADDRRALTRVQSATALYQDQRARAKGEEEALQALEAPEDRVAALEAAIAKEEGELDALNLALEVLTAANAQLQTRFSPALNQRAGAILAQLTGGRYDRLVFTRDFDVLAQTDAGPKTTQLLSQGTADQAYLALRLAICHLALPQGFQPPLVLDDALVAFDDTRLKLALGVLSELAQERQVLLFTCQSRERLALSGLPGAATPTCILPR